MTVKPLETNLTIIWWTRNANPIVENDGLYFLKNNNKVRLNVFRYTSDIANITYRLSYGMELKKEVECFSSMQLTAVGCLAKFAL